MDPSSALLSQIVSFRTYSKYLNNFQRRETWEETVNRSMTMHLDKFPKLSKKIMNAFEYVHDKNVLGSMRGLQFNGTAALRNPIRSYNCAATAVDDPCSFGEILFCLLSGTGVGFSVQKEHIARLPKIQQPLDSSYYIIADSIEGWAQALDALTGAYFYRKVKPEFDFSMIRPRGSILVTTGAKAPGPEALKHALKEVEIRLKAAIGRKLRPIEAHDIICLISDCVLAGGIRRAATLSLFSKDDEEMLKAKSGAWWEKHPYRARANNSAALDRKTTTKEEFFYIYNICKSSGAGEPGFIWLNNTSMSCYNPCFAPETLITTRQGTYRIEDLVGKTVDIWNGKNWQTVNNFRVTAGNQPILKIELHDGSQVRATPYHTFILENGDRVQAKDLKVNDKLKISLIETDGPVSAKGAYLKGFLIGDGTIDTNRMSPILWLYDTKYMCEERLIESAKELDIDNDINYQTEVNLSFVGSGNNRKNMKGLVARRNSLKDWCLAYKHGLPAEIFAWDRKSKLEFLAGLMDSDGTASDTKNGFMYQLTSVNKQLLLDVQNLLKTIGVLCKLSLSKVAGVIDFNDGYGEYKTQDVWRITISQNSSIKLASQICFTRLISFASKTTAYKLAPKFNKITSIQEDGNEEKVYCCTVEESHSLTIAAGIHVGQCSEIGLNTSMHLREGTVSGGQFCNLTSVNQTGVTSKQEFLNRVKAASFIGTLQASYTDFPYLRDSWRKITEEEALIGVSFTGIADSYGNIEDEWLREGAELVKSTNESTAKAIGINRAARTTTVKPEGSGSCVCGSSSGIHARHAPFYLRRVRMVKDDALSKYLQSTIPDLCEDAKSEVNTMIVTVPQRAPANGIIRNNETALQLFNRVINYNTNWISPGHVSGNEKHNVSCTINVRENEWDTLGEQMWLQRDKYAGISLLPYDDSSYIQMPFEECTEDTFNKYMGLVKEVDLRQVVEEENNTDLSGTVACAGGSCEITKF